MSARRTLAIARRIAEFFRRDHRTLALMFVAPLVIMGLLGWVIRDQKPTTSTVAIVNILVPKSTRRPACSSTRGVSPTCAVRVSSTSRPGVRWTTTTRRW